MRTLKLMLLLGLIVAITYFWRQTPAPTTASGPSTSVNHATDRTLGPDFLPPQAHATLALIAHHGPFQHRQDGSVFQNREGHLPRQPRGYYHEYTVETPGSRDRGARRIITGGTPPTTYYYTDDHYRSFRAFKAKP